jgi:uncharacterized membrane protein YdbT with pleckstrin-like domain
LGLLGWATLNFMSVSVDGQPAPIIVQFGILGLTTLLGFRWLVRDGLGWFFCWYVLTNQRLVVSRGVLRRNRQEAATARIQTIHVERTNPVANALAIGDVQVLTASSTGAIWLRGVHHPEDVAYTVDLVRQGKLGAPEEAESPGAHSALEAPPVRAALDLMLLEEGSTDDDDLGEDDVDQAHLLAGGILRHAIDIALLPGERVLDRLYRHWFTLLTRLLPPFGIGVGVILLLAVLRGFIPPAASLSWGLTVVAGLVTLVWNLLIIANYVDDVFILTNQRIIDIDRTYFIFAESRRETLYRSVQDVSINLPLIGRFFSYGHINVETAGRAPNIEMRNMSHPRRTQERIFALINADRERRAEADRKSQHKELHSSVSAVLTRLMLATPDVRSLPVTAAVTRLRAAGLTVVIAGERPDSQTRPGSVLTQTPSPGATILRGSEVALTLSRRPTRAHA